MIPLHDDNPTSIQPVVTVAIIVLCALVFLWMIALPPPAQQRLVFALGFIPATLFDGRALAPELALVPAELTVLTAMFLHGGWLHLIGNMLFLWIFGNNVEDSMGHARYVVFYAACGVAAAFAQAFLNPGSTIPMIGASGAVAGVLGAYLLLYPHARVMVLVPIGFILRTVRLPALVVLGFWAALQLISAMLADPTAGGVAFGAHVGGFVAGMALIPLFKYRNVRLWNPPHRSRG